MSADTIYMIFKDVTTASPSYENFESSTMHYHYALPLYTVALFTIINFFRKTPILDVHSFLRLPRRIGIEI